MQRERIADNVYSFQSDLYAQVTAGAVLGPNWAVIIDTLAVPEETVGIRDFIEHEINLPVRYVINTHYHADHAWGNYLFPGATIIAHTMCRQLLAKSGPPSLEEVKKQNSSYRNVKIVLPHLTFDDSTVILRIGKKTLSMFSLPGSSPDNIGILVEEDRVLFAGDAFMPLPYVVDGDIDALTMSIKRIGKMGLENVVQGHGDIVLRGEIDGAVRDNLTYLSAIRKAVRKASRRKYPMDILAKTSLEECGKSRVLIGGLAVELHRRNLRYLYQKIYGEFPKSRPDDDLDFDDYNDDEE